MKVESDSPFYFVEHRKMSKNECYYVLMTNLILKCTNQFLCFIRKMFKVIFGFYDIQGTEDQKETNTNSNGLDAGIQTQI